MNLRKKNQLKKRRLLKRYSKHFSCYKTFVWIRDICNLKFLYFNKNYYSILIKFKIDSLFKQSSEETRDTRLDFCVNPEKVRQAYEERRQSKLAARNKGSMFISKIRYFFTADVRNRNRSLKQFSTFILFSCLLVIIFVIIIQHFTSFETIFYSINNKCVFFLWLDNFSKILDLFL